MKSFTVIAAIATVLLVALPLLILQSPSDADVGGLVVAWRDDGSPVTRARPVVRWDSFSATLRSIDPVTCGDILSSRMQSNVFEGLYTYHYLQRPPEVIPLLAAALPEISEDRMTYTIPIRKGVLYARNPCFGREANGRCRTREVTAHDFVLTFKRCGDFHIPPALPWSFLNQRVVGITEYRETIEKHYEAGDFSRYDLDVEGVRAVDDHTLRIRLTRPFPQFVFVLAMHSYAPTPREAIDHWLAGTDPPMSEFRNPEGLVGTGPYLLAEYKPKDRIVLARNPDFREDLYPAEGDPGDEELGLLADAGKRVPFIDVLRYDWMPQRYSTWMNFLYGRTDVAAIPREMHQAVITPGQDLTEEWRKSNIYLRKSWAAAIYRIGFNMENEVFAASPSLRQAACLAFDVENYVKILYNDRGKRAVNIIPSALPGHAEAGPGPYFRFDLAAARRKVADAKRELAAAGLLEPDGSIPPLVIDLTRRDRIELHGEFFKHQFRSIGVPLRVVYNDWATQQTKVKNKQSQMFYSGWYADYPDAENFFQLYYSGNIKEGINNTNYSDPDFDRWYEAAAVMPSTPQRMELYVKMARKISEDCPVLLLTEPLNLALFHDWVHNVKFHTMGYGYLKYQRIDPEMRDRLGGRR